MATNRVVPDNKIITNYTDTTNYTDQQSTPTTRLSPTSTSWTTPSRRGYQQSRQQRGYHQPQHRGQHRLGSILTSWDNFEVMDGMTEGVQRDVDTRQISRPTLTKRAIKKTTMKAETTGSTFMVEIGINLDSNLERMPSPTYKVSWTTLRSWMV